jgi:hypothetical protein
MGAGGRGAAEWEARVVQETTRRRVLAAAAAALPLVAVGCKGIGALGTPPKPAPDVAVVRDAMAVESYLIARYGAVLAAVPGLAWELRPLLAQHHEHLARLRTRLIIPRAGAQPSPSPKAASPSAAPPPGTPAAALAYLRDAENAAAASLLAHLDAATPSLAQLLASISASEATHALVLGAPGRPR